MRIEVTASVAPSGQARRRRTSENGCGAAATAKVATGSVTTASDTVKPQDGVA